LRGLFLRGLNTFDAVSEEEGRVSRVNENYKDPEPRVRGSFQTDEVKPHTHPYLHRSHFNPPHTSGSGGSFAEQDKWADTEKNNGKETRPKNAAVFYYIRIN
jgi:hypothetical protein